MADNRPRGRKKNVTGPGKGVHLRKEGTGHGPVGSGSGLSEGYHGGGNYGSSSGGGGKRAGGGKLPLLIIILVALFGGGGGLGSLLGGFGGGGGTGGGGGSLSTGGGAAPYISSLQGGGVSSGWTDSSNLGQLNRDVSPQARKRFATIKGNGADIMTIMVYMCGADLESRSGMATSDLAEMQSATISNKINLIVCTGGATRWRNNIVSNKVNEIYQIQSGQVKRLNQNFSKGAMTDPANLTAFIKYCKKNFPGDRNALIFWDHGGGSVTGYGYDEKYPRSGSMTLAGINTALTDAKSKFDFIGFDTCLMATVENAQMLAKYADYLIASEETEPGVGWYYTNWLTKLSQNTSMETLDIGKNIIDDFVTECNRKCPGQKTTLSMVDLAELSQTLPEQFRSFSADTRDMIKNNEYKTVSGARSGAREFARSTAIDQIDMVHFAKLMGTQEGKNLAKVLLSSVKYNRTSSNMTNAYGLSVHFPYQRASKVDTAARTYEQIGMDEEYTQCIREFAGLEVSGQVATGGSGTPMPSLFDLMGQGSSGSGSSSVQGMQDITNLLQMFMQSGKGISDLNKNNTGFLDERDMTMEETASYIADNQLDTANLLWKKKGNGAVISMDKDQWSLVRGLAISKYLDDGEGYVDLGVDAAFDLDDDGDLIGETDNTWVSINDQPVAYYHTDTMDDGTNYSITGYVPAKLNGEDVKLILIYDNDHEDGYVAGAQPVYPAKVTETESRGLIDLKKGDTLEFYFDYYTYDGKYISTYTAEEPVKVTDKPLVVSDTILDEPSKVKALFRFTDIYHQYYWSQLIPNITDAGK